MRLTVSEINNICILTLNNPPKFNALSQLFFDEFEDFIENLSNNKKIKVLIIRGIDAVFSSGGDLKEMLLADYNTAQIMCRRCQKNFQSLMTLEIPTIAMIDGLVFGAGFELALHCDIRFCSENSVFKFPETNLGLIPASGGISLFSKYFSPADTAYYLFGSQEIPIQKLLNRGIIQEVIKTENLFEFTMNYANKISKISNEAIAKCKKILYSNLFSDLNYCLNLETLEFSSLLQTEGKEKIKQLFNKKNNNV